jgi:rubrerythrin
MSATFNADEILAVAMQIERNGARFYLYAAEKASSPSAREFFRGLAVLEQSHEKTFGKMREELSDDERRATTFDPENQTEAYLKALADGRVFDLSADPVQKLTGRESPKDILTLAIGMEKNSIVFYLGIKELVPERLGRNKIDAIIREEMRHITVLSNELAAV